jgi:hypothetical protein
MDERKLQHIHVICYKWGTLYDASHVNKLASMVNRHLSVKHDFHCITDNTAGLDKNIIAHPLPDYGFQGIWRKLMTFKSDFIGLEGQHVLSLDIDVVVISSLDFSARDVDRNFLIARNWTKGTRGSGCMYRLKVGSMPQIWERFIENPELGINKFHGKNRLIGEQNWLEANIKDFHFFEDGKVVSYKRHCNAKGLVLKIGSTEIINTARIGSAHPPENAALVSFHGEPSQNDVMNTYCGRWRHAPFIKEHWN